ncbi:MAG TPA: mechanosensitive ion channel family protein [Methylomirabilota bacterium]|nr:mechanosensitive ion channel family protein [Methylomirabilota bacterium]
MNLDLTKWTDFALSHGLRLFGILLLALVLNRILRVVTRRLIQIAPPSDKTRGTQMHEQHTRTLSGIPYSGGTAVILILAVLMALPELGFSVTPLAAAAGLASLALGFGAQNLVRDCINGFFIIFEEQFVVGDTVCMGATVGRVEHVTLRRTVLRDPAGALVTIPNSEIGVVANLSRDWGQLFVDVTIPADGALDASLEALAALSLEFRSEPDWSPVVVDGPRVLGVESLTPTGAVLRLQVRTAPTRQDDVARELRRRIQIRFEREHLRLGEVRRVELIELGARPRPEPAETRSPRQSS